MATCCNNFSVKLLKELDKSRNGNLIVSGYSIFYVCSMALMGCVGETYDELKAGLSIDDSVSEEDLLSSIHEIDNLLSKGSNAFVSSNSIWTNELKEDYITGVKNKLGGDAFPLTTAEAINSYVSSKTNNLIKNLVQNPLDPNTIAMLINSIYFKGTWKDQFPKEKTYSGSFTLSDENEIFVQTMIVKSNFLALKSPSITAVEIP